MNGLGIFPLFLYCYLTSNQLRFTVVFCKGQLPMKKLVVMSVVLLFMVNAKANVLINDKEVKSHLGEEVFIIDNDNIHYVRVTNPYKTPFVFRIHVNDTFFKNGRTVPSDRVTFHCGADYYMNPGDTMQCTLLSIGSWALITVNPANFKNGAEIVYTH